MNLTLATSLDISEIYRLANKIWYHHYVPIVGQEQVDYMIDKIYSQVSLTEQMHEKKHLFYLITEDNENFGFLSISGAEEKFIHKFYIDQDVQGKGIGSSVFEELKKLFPDTKSFELTVNRQNYKSINFYFKLGFKIDHIADFDIGNGYWMNDFVMKYKMHDPSSKILNLN
jgi:RimJ/RimL family protein N-acetyltransferase